MNKELVTIDRTDALNVFTKHRGLDPFLKRIRKELDGFKPDISTSVGRKMVASIAHKVTRSKIYLDDVGKDLVAELKLKPKLIDKERLRIRRILDEWRDEVRQPLTDWENAETSRVKRHNENMAEISVIQNTYMDGIDSSLIKNLLGKLEKISVNDSWQEFKEQGLALHSEAMGFLDKKLNRQVKYEAEQKELNHLKEEEEQRKTKEREKRIATEAAERERKEAEALALRVKEKAKLREAELKLKAERAESEKKETKIQAERDRLEAIELAVKEKREAIETERERLEFHRKQKERREEAKRADLEHRKSVHKRAVRAMVDSEIDESVAAKVVTLASQRKLDPLVLVY